MRRKLLQENIPEALLFIAFCIIQFLHINVDFWNDEIYTIKHFTLTSFAKTSTDYHVPNNHVFFNLVNNAYLKLINLTQLDELMDNPFKLRIIPFLYSLLTVFYTYQIGKKFFTRPIALISSIILITTIPFFYFSLQIRGYGLSTLLLTMIFYYSFSYTKLPRKVYLVLIILLTALIIYTIPSNIYFVASLMFIYGIYLLIFISKLITKDEGIFRKTFMMFIFK